MKSLSSSIFPLSMLTLFVMALPISQVSGSVDKSFKCTKTLTNGAEILSRIQKSYENVQAFTARFEQSSYLHALDVSEVSTGDVWFLKPGKMKWNYDSPEEQIFLLKDNTYWFYQAYDKQLLIENFERAFHSDLPVSFLLGIGELDKEFMVKKACEGTLGFILTLTPRDKSHLNGKAPHDDDSLSILTLVAAKDTHLPTAIKITDAATNTTALLLQNLQNKNTISESIFNVDFPNGIDIQDNRMASDG